MPRKEEIETEIRGFDDAYSDVEQACRAAIEWPDKTMIEKGLSSVK